MTDFIHQLLQAREGSSEALSNLLGKYRRLLLWTANQTLDAELRTKMGASDVVQETMLEAVRDFQQFCGETDEEWQAWLRQVLANNLANADRRFRRTTKRSLEREKSMDAKSAVRRAVEFSAQREVSPDVLAIQKESGISLHLAITALPDDYRQLLMLRYQQQMAFTDIAKHMCRSENAVRKLWARAVQALQNQMEHEQ